jgi:hypothetical protein
VLHFAGTARLDPLAPSAPQLIAALLPLKLRHSDGGNARYPQATKSLSGSNSLLQVFALLAHSVTCTRDLSLS